VIELANELSGGLSAGRNGEGVRGRAREKAKLNLYWKGQVRGERVSSYVTEAQPTALFYQRLPTRLFKSASVVRL
jgi:hypothetical protein